VEDVAAIFFPPGLIIACSGFFVNTGNVSGVFQDSKQLQAVVLQSGYIVLSLSRFVVYWGVAIRRSIGHGWARMVRVFTDLYPNP